MPSKARFSPNDRFSPVTGRYVTIDVEDPDLGGEHKVFFLENGEGRPLICQHTAGCHNHQWRGLLEDPDITSRYRVIAYDLPRHGKSDPPNTREWWKEEYKLTADFYVKFIVELCDALELEDPIFMGSSFGGNVALQLALRHPDRFGGVIPVEAAAYSPGFFLDWWQHPHANAAQVCASGVWDLMAPQSPDQDRWKTWFYYTQASEAFRGDLYFLLRGPRPAREAGRDRHRALPRGVHDRGLRLPDHTRDDEGDRGPDQGLGVHRDEGHRPLPDEREPAAVQGLPRAGARAHRVPYRLTRARLI
jgi:pimeloyl-ACP methyl ester carboxylesterase